MSNELIEIPTGERLQAIRDADISAGPNLQGAPPVWSERRDLLKYIQHLEACVAQSNADVAGALANANPYEYGLGEPVFIKAAEFPARVTGLLTDSNGQQYRVIWWHNGDRKQEWLFGPELEPRAEDGK